MARRDNQGIQIAMIVFILTTLLFMVGTYMGYSSWAAANGELEQTKADLEQSNRQTGDAVRVASGLKTSIGLDSSLGDDAAETEAKKLVTDTMGQGLPEESQNFLGIVRARDARIADLAQQLFDANKQVQDLRTQLATAKDSFAKSIADAKAREDAAHDGYKTAEDDLVAERQKNRIETSKLTDERNSMMSRMNKTVSDSEKQVASATKQRDDAIRRAEMKQEELNVIKSDTPDRYDGRILGVVAATKTVLIDRGRADGIRAKMTFTVYDADDSNIRNAQRKASIEVTRVLSDHRSEARITDAFYTTPIVSDDQIYSPIWSPGTRLGVALVGKMDIDKDGRDDRDYIRNLINTNGGQVDAEVVDGKRVGSMSVNTRYIIVGEKTEGLDNRMLEEAKLLTIERMSVGELIDLISPPGRARSIQFNSVPRPGDFAPKPRDGVRRVSPGSTSFRSRSPTARRAGAK